MRTALMRIPPGLKRAKGTVGMVALIEYDASGWLRCKSVVLARNVAAALRRAKLDSTTASVKLEVKL